MKNRSKMMMPLRQRRCGFSLLELLVSISVILTLAYLVVLSSHLVRRSMDRSVCAANLRQVGIAILSYANDNGGRLPGPVLGGQRASYNATNGQLGRYLYSYFNYPAPPAKGTEAAPIFECPVQRRIHPPSTESPVFYLCRATRFTDGMKQQPFGYAATGVIYSLPMKLQNTVRQSETVALIDATAAAPLTDFHQTGRNVLFLDGHVEHINKSRLEVDAAYITVH